MNNQNLDVDTAYNALRSWYWGYVKTRCQLFLDAIIDFEKHAEEPDEDDARIALESILDDACIYNRDNAIILAATDNDDAYAENFGSEGIVDGDGVLRFDRLAYAALEADILDTLNRAGFDWDDVAGTARKALEWFEA